VGAPLLVGTALIVAGIAIVNLRRAPVRRSAASVPVRSPR
jgi:hypothetical protein